MAEQKFVLKCGTCGNGFLVFEIPDKSMESNLRGMYEKSKARYGGYLSVRLNMPYKPRTTGAGSQNSKIWAMMRDIAAETGCEVEDVEREAKRRAVRRGYPVHENRFTGEMVPNSMATISTEEAGFLIEELEQIAAEYCNMLL